MITNDKFMKSMKKFFYLLFALPLFFAACDDDDNLPQVDITVDFENATKVDDAMYVVKGDTLVVDAINVTNRESGKKAIATGAIYYLDGLRIGASVISPFYFRIPTDNLPAQEYTLNIETEIFAVDKAPAYAVLGYNFKVVDSADDIPGNAPARQGVRFSENPDLKAK